MVNKSPGAKASVRELYVGPSSPHPSVADTRGKSLYIEGDVLQIASMNHNNPVEELSSTDNIYPSEPVA